VLVPRLLAASWLLIASTAQAASEPRVVFHFSASSSLFARPGVGHDGALYIGSGDGYVHALAADGTFRWSYTVKGRVAAPPVEEASSGRIFVATSEARLYALETDSHLRWVFPLPVAPKSELMLTPKGTLLFVGQDDYLYGVTTGGALTLRLAATGARSAPAWVSSGQAVLVLGDALATLKGYGYERAPLPSAFGDSARLALDADRAIFACENGVARVVAGAREELSVASDCLSAPVRAGGFFAIAEASDAVRLVYGPGRSRTIPLGATPLRPIWDAARRRLINSTSTVSVTVLELQGEP
jgi:outer membrane protein assembly factor BamB